MIFSVVLIATFVIHHLLIGALLLAVLQLAILIMRPGPELKCTLWTTAFIVCTVMPFFLIESEQKTRILDIATPVNSTSIQANQSFVEQTAIPISTGSLQVPVSFVYDHVFWIMLLGLLWLVGSSRRMIALLKSAYLTHELVVNAEPCNSDLALGKVRLLQSEKAGSPMAVGYFKPVVLLPKHLVSALTDAQLHPIVLHELAHIKRHDVWVGLIQEILAILFWWSPVMRLINRKIHISRELSCDLQAIRTLNSVKCYAQSLLDCTALMLRQQKNVMAMGLFSKKKELLHRVDEIVKPKYRIAPNKWLNGTACLLFALSSVVSAKQFAPSIDLTSIYKDSRHFSALSTIESEQLLTAIKNNQLADIQRMAQEGIDINTPLDRDGTALMVAVRRGNRTMVESLLAMGADPNQSSLRDGNPLIIAAQVDNTALISLLIASGADVNAIVPYDETPLINASRFASLTAVRLLVENGADVNLGVMVNEWRRSEYRSPLNMANSATIRDYLIAQGATE